MKKVLLSLTAGLLSVTMASAQCTPLAAYADSSFGLWPDSVPFLEAGPMAGMAYQSQIDIKTFVDTLFAGPTGPVTASIDAFKVLSITGQPAGFTWTAGGAEWVQADSTWYNPYGTPGDASTLSSTQGCMTITADANATSAAAPATGYTDYPLLVLVDARIARTQPDLSFILANGTWLSDPDFAALTGGALPINSYVLRVYAATGVAEMLNTSRFELGQNYPNPAADESVINFTTPSVSNVEFRVYNMLGMLG
jgi:hypothetical protein